MPDEKKPRHPEVNFLPPLGMILSFFKKKTQPSPANQKVTAEAEQKEADEKAVEKLIEKLHEKDK